MRGFSFGGCFVLLFLLAAIGAVAKHSLEPKQVAPEPPAFAQYEVVLYSIDNLSENGGKSPAWRPDEPQYMTVALWPMSGGRGNESPTRIPETGDGVPARVLDRRLVQKTKDPWLYVKTRNGKKGWIMESLTRKPSE